VYIYNRNSNGINLKFLKVEETVPGAGNGNAVAKTGNIGLLISRTATVRIEIPTANLAVLGPNLAISVYPLSSQSLGDNIICGRKYRISLDF